MEIVTKKYFVSFLNCFFKLCTLKDIDTLNSTEKEIQELIKQMKKFDLLEVNHFDTSISIPKKLSEFEERRFILIFKLYWIIVENLFGIPWITDNSYENFLWSALLSLNYEDYKILQDISVPFKQNVSASGLRYYYISLDENGFNTFKSKSKNINELIFKEDEKIELILLEKIKLDITVAIDSYNKYVESNYSLIQNHFSFYKNSIRVYPLKSPNIKSENLMFKLIVYDTRDLPPIALCNKYATFASKLGNVEEFDYQIRNDVLLISDPKQENLFENIFSIQSIHHELIRNFTKLADEGLLFDLVDYLLTIDRNDIIYRNKKEFIIKILKNKDQFLSYNFHFSKKISVDNFEKIDESVKYVFLVKPDDEIVNKIGKDNILYITDFTKHYLNQAVHYFVKDNLKNLKTQEDNGLGYLWLIDRLEKCTPGREDWNKFENIGIEIFDFLFKDDFRHFSFEK